MNKRTLRGTCVIFLAFIALFFALNLVMPDRDFSQQENRSLQTTPKFTFESLFSGEFMSDFESYCSDQFVMRDRWISMKARMELLLGKSENNGVFLCDEERLLEPFTAPVQSDLDSRIYAINALADNTKLPVYLGLIPSASEIYRDMLPAGVKNDSQLDVIQYVYDGVHTNTVDLASVLREHSAESIFYRTDHHWTSLGAYYGYCAIGDSLGFSPLLLNEFPYRQVVSEEFYGTTYSTSGFAWIEPDSMEMFLPQPESVMITRYEGPEGKIIPLYDSSRLAVKDKYSYYLGGNTPRLVIETGMSDKPVLLILRDSYCDSLTPFLLQEFSEIHILDLRYYRSSVAEYAAENEIDQILILYNVNNFSTDRNLVLLSR